MEDQKKDAGQLPVTESLEDTPKAANPDNEKSPLGPGAPENAEGSAPDGGKDKRPLLVRIRRLPYLYVIIFGLLLVLATAGGIALIKWQDSIKSKTGVPLTSSQLSQLQGNTTIVGDSKQTLDIQGASIFEGAALFKNDLNVAGGVKLGGALSLPNITVGDQGSFGQLQVNNKLSVSGDSALSGQLSVQKSLTVVGNASISGNLSASQLSVSSLNFSGDLVISRHISAGGGLPGKTNGTALGTGGTVSVNGGDSAGTITVNTGSSPAAGSFVTVNFSTKYTNTPHVVVTPVGSAGAGLQYYVTRTTTGFTLSTANTPPAGSSFSFDYIVFD